MFSWKQLSHICYAFLDMEKTLKELNVEDRATMVLVANAAPISQDTSSSAVNHTSTNVINDTSNSGWIWKQLSYLNPLSYFKGSNSETDNDGSGGSSWQYGSLFNLDKK